jgi:hypothetical protein
MELGGYKWLGSPQPAVSLLYIEELFLDKSFV